MIGGGCVSHGGCSIGRGRILVVSAPSGSGKGTVIGKLLAINPSVSLSISYTSRAPRVNEAEGEHYYFITKPRFEEMIDGGEFIEWDSYQCNYYGTSRQKIEQILASGADVVFDITIKGAYAIRNYYPHAALVFIVPPSFEELERRLKNRGTETDEKIKGRLAEARREILSLNRFDYVVINDDAAKAGNCLNSILSAEKCRIDDAVAEGIINKL